MSITQERSDMWEYRIINDHEIEWQGQTEEMINRMGRDRWELVSVLKDPEDIFWFYFKRPVMWDVERITGGSFPS